MTTEILGSVTYLETPTVNGTAVLLNGSNPTTANVTFGNVVASGTLTASNLSGTNTGDQTITLTGDVTGSGTGSFATTLANVGTAGTYTTVTTDATGRITSGSTTQAWSTITATPTTLAGYGITDGGGGGGGSVLQTFTTAVAAATGTSTVTLNNTAPTIATGTQIWSQAITPATVTSKVALRGAFIVANSTAARTMVAMVFRGSTCISVTGQYCATANTLNSVSISIVDQPASTAAQTYTIRIAGSGVGTWYVGQTATAYFAGLLATSDILLQEIA